MTMDTIHDYEYYEARAKDAKMEDITSDEYNADILAGLRDGNDPDFKCLAIVAERDDFCDFIVREGDDLGWLGYFVGKSKQIGSLYIDSFPENSNFSAFFRGLGQNRSIKTLQIGVDIGESFQSLVPFLRNNDILRVLNFIGFEIGLQCARNIAFLVSQKPTLKRLEFDGTDIDHQGFLHIVIALKKVPQIEALLLNAHYDSLGIRRDGCVALGRMLGGWRSPNLKRLVLNGDLEDEGLCALSEGLRNCHSLTSLDLTGNESITKEGWRSLSTLFQSDSCRLEHLNLGEMNIDDGGMAVLATGLASLPSLKGLNLWANSIGDQGLQKLVRGLVNCNLEVLDLSRNMLMESISGLRSLGTLVRRSTNMRSLSLCNSSLTDEGLQSFIEGMANSCSLTELSLSRNRLITANGLASLSSLFQAEHCSLSDLSLYHIHLGDDGAAALVNGLVGNKSLTPLRFNVSGITARGWTAFARLLCNTSSVNSTYLSNHTLEEIWDYGLRDTTPSDILEYLKWNKSHNQAAAISKILDSHPDIDVTPLFEFNLKCLPLVVAWLEKAKLYLDKVNESTESFQRRQLSAVYKFIRGIPQLAVDGYRREKKTKHILSDAKKKRKFDLTL